MAEYKLELKGVSKSFPGVKALDNVQLFLRPGSVLALMGENGAGKSTLMKCLFGIYHMDAGEIYIDGERYCNGTSGITACTCKVYCREYVSWTFPGTQIWTTSGH